MKQDIENRSDLELLLTEFYKIATTDAEIGHHFAGLNLAAHLPIIVDFWEKVLFGKQIYFGNPLFVHQKLNEKSTLELEHFRRWVEIFSQTVDEFFAGETAENAKLRAKMIAHSLHQAVHRQNLPGVQISK
ncbi:MAG: group III truncated hemoglobin [Acidobacteriota bacterium]|nr:group III truncated hemoglobin [Acidobacteriota bacterium]